MYRHHPFDRLSVAMSSDLRVNQPTQNGEDGETVEELRAWAPATRPQKQAVVLSETLATAGRKKKHRISVPQVQGRKCPVTAALAIRLGTMPLLAGWVAERGAVVKLVAYCLRGIGQVFLCNNPVSGLLFAVAVLSASWRVACLMILGVMSSTLCAWACQFDRSLLASGIWGYNGALVGCALAVFCYVPSDDTAEAAVCNTVHSTVWTIVGVIFGACLSVFLTQMSATALVPHGLTPLTFPFQLSTWIWMLAAQHWQGAGLSGAPVPELMASSVRASSAVSDANGTSITFNFPQDLEPFLHGVGQTFLVDKWYSGIIMLLGIFLCSPISAAWATIGAVIGTILSSAASAPAGPIEAGLYGYNSCLCAIALGGFFLVQSGWQQNLVVCFGMILSTLLTASTAALFAPLGLPALTWPFTLATWILVFVAKGLPGVVTVAVAALSTAEDHSKRLRLSRAVTTHFSLLAQFAEEQSTASTPEDIMRIEATLLPIALCAAAAAGDIKELERFLELGAPVDSTDYDGRTPLHLASAQAQVSCVRILVQRITEIDPDLVNAEDTFGSTPLEDAIRSADQAINRNDQDATVALLMAHGARLNFESKLLRSLGPRLCEIAADGNTRALELYLKAGAEPKSADYDGRTAAHLAAAGSHSKAIDLDVLLQLIRKGGSSVAAAVDAFGNTPIDDAIRHEFSDAADLLRGLCHTEASYSASGPPAAPSSVVVHTSVEMRNEAVSSTEEKSAAKNISSAPLGSETKFVESALHAMLPAQASNLERSGKNQDNQDLTKTGYLLPSLLCSAAASGDTDSIERACERLGTNNIAALADYDGRTPLHIAVENKRINVVKLLISRGDGSMIHQEDRWGVSPLWTAITSCDESMVKLLRSYSLADRGSGGSSPSSVSLSPTMRKVATYLCSLAAKPESARTKEALRIAIDSGGLDPNAFDYDGRTALHVGARSGNWEICKTLLSLGARRDAMDRWGKTPALDSSLESVR